MDDETKLVEFSIYWHDLKESVQEQLMKEITTEFDKEFALDCEDFYTAGWPLAELFIDKETIE